MTWSARVAVVCAPAVAMLTACSGAPAFGGSTAASAAPRTVTVLAASSLTDFFTELAGLFEATHPDVRIEMSFGSSSALAQQIVEGAPVQVFAAASPTAMQAAGARIVDAANYLTNHVVVAVPVPAGTAAVLVDGGGAAELDRVRTWIQCAHEAPCGAAADAATSLLGVTSSPASLEPNVASVVAKLLAGEADAGIVYLTDARAARDKLSVVEFGTFAAGSPQAAAITTQYRIGLVDGGDADAQAFVDFARSAPIVEAATARGFGPPPA